MEWKLMLAVMAATGIGFMGANMMPMWLGAVMDGLALGPEQAGWLGTAELAAGTAASLLVAPLAARIPRRTLALAACALAIGGYALSAAASAYLSLALIRAATGFCCGIVLAAGNAAAAGARDPDRVFALVGLVAGLAASAILVVMGYVADWWGYAGVFLLLAAVVFASWPLLSWLPETSPAAGIAPSGSPRLALAPLATVTAAFVLSISGQGLWAFTERIGVGIGLETERIGWWISIANLCGLPAAALAAWLSTRLGRTFPIALGLCVSGSAHYTLVHAESELVYVAAQVAWGLAFFFWTPFLMGTAAALDRRGRWTVVAGAVTMMGVALGPGVAGALLEHWPETGLGVLVVGCAATGLLLLLPVTIALDRSGEPAPAAGDTAVVGEVVD